MEIVAYALSSGRGVPTGNIYRYFDIDIFDSINIDITNIGQKNIDIANIDILNKNDIQITETQSVNFTVHKVKFSYKKLNIIQKTNKFEIIYIFIIQ